MRVFTEDDDTVLLVERTRAGEDAFGAIYQRYFDRAYRYARTITGDAHEAEDVTQEAFLRAFEALGSYQPCDVPFRAWLFRIVHNVAVRRAERAQRLRPVGEPSLIDAPVQGPPRIDGLDALLAELPLPQRQVLLLRFQLDLSPRQTALVLGRSPESVRQLQCRAIATLRTKLGSPCSGSTPARYSSATSATASVDVDRPHPFREGADRGCFEPHVA